MLNFRMQRRERLGLAPGDTDPALDELSDEEYVFREEPEELVAARARLAAFTARPGEEEPTGGAQGGQILQAGKAA